MDPINVIKSAIEEINDLRDVKEQIDDSFAGILIGPNGILDSLETTTFILVAERNAHDLYRKKVDLASILLSDDGLNKDFDTETIAALIDEQL